MLQSLNEVSYKKKKTEEERDRYWDGDMKIWRGRQGGRGRAVSWLCAQRQENKPLKVIPLIHLDNTEASSYRPLPQLYTQTHTFHSFPDRPSTPTPPSHPHPHQLLADCWKEREGWNEAEVEEGGGRSGGIKEGREEQLRFTLWAMQRRWC